MHIHDLKDIVVLHESLNWSSFVNGSIIPEYCDSLVFVLIDQILKKGKSVLLVEESTIVN